MKTQISRDSFLPGLRYSGVYLQQGRMILDADWNELTDIQKARLVDALRDAISGMSPPEGTGIAGGAPRDGGLGIYDATPPAAQPATIRIKPGVLYVEGVPARLVSDVPLAINAQPEYPLPLQSPASYSGKNLRLYADVWERNVTALEQSGLMDAAMHGADTASRSQTMLQVKWCANTVNPMDATQNPPIGDAPLKLMLRLVGTSGDKCDPCANQVKVDERIGNYLFRVEVHDYDATPGARVLTLKWSRDNGTEACEVNKMPEGFNQGDWAWEYFDDNTEKLLGNHFAGGINTNKLHGRLQKNCSTPGNDYPNTYVRQWDGYIQINLDSETLSDGCDHGQDLVMGELDNDAHGRVNLTDGMLRINLELMVLELAIASGEKNHAFVPGDYWLAVVREAEHQSGQYVLPPMPDLSVPDEGVAPRGVVHHYLWLAELTNQGKLAATDDAFRRRMNFPPLSDIHAADVGFTDNCVKLYAGAKNLQQALDNLCAISAEDIAYPLPNCAGNEGKSIKNRLFTTDPTTVGDALDKLLCKLNATSLPYIVPACSENPSVRSLLGLAAEASSNVAPVLDKLLCELDAAKLPYTLPDCPANPNVFSQLGLSAADNNVASVLGKLLCGFNANDLPLLKGAGGLCSDLMVDEVVTVQDALKVLCNKSGGCAVTVTSPQHLQLLLEEFASGSATDLWLCLKAGSYSIPADLAITGKGSLRLSGQGAESTYVSFSGANWSVEAGEVMMENLSLTFANGAGHLAISASSVQAHGCHFSRTSGNTNAPVMITIGRRGSDACRLSWRDNVLHTRLRVFGRDLAVLAQRKVVGDAKLGDVLQGLVGYEPRLANADYKAALKEAATLIAGMSAVQRNTWVANFQQAPVSPLNEMVVRSATADPSGTANMLAVLAKDVATPQEILSALNGMVTAWVRYEPDFSLCLADQKVGGVMEGNAIEGWLLLGNGITGNTSPPKGGISGVGDMGDVVIHDGEDLALLSNSITAIKANLVLKSITSPPGGGVYIVGQVNGHARITLVGNRIKESGNCITASSLVAQGNCWPGNGQDLGYAVVNCATFTGNLVDGGIGITASTLNVTVLSTLLVDSGNLLLQLHAMGRTV